MLTIIFTEVSMAHGVRARPCDAEEEMTVREKIGRALSPLGLTKVHETELAAKLRVSGHLRSDVSLPLPLTQTPSCHRIREVLGGRP